MRRAIVLGVVLACGDNGPSLRHDASPGSDADIDGSSSGAMLVALDEGGAPIASVTFASTLVGQRASVPITIKNIGTATSGPISLAVSGAAANDYVIDPQTTTCNEPLDADATCVASLVFRPTQAGSHTAWFEFSATSSGSGSVAATGTAVFGDVRFVPTTISLGMLETGTSAEVTVELANTGTTAAPIDSISSGGAILETVSSTCGASLSSGTSCFITVRATAPTLGAILGDVSVSTGGTIFSAPTLGSGVHRITIIRGGNSAGVGEGHITSSPAGIDCGGSGTTCTALFPGGVTLTAVPDANSVFTGWSVEGCDTSTTCAIPASIPHEYVLAAFAANGRGATLEIVMPDPDAEVRVTRSPSLVSPGDRVATCYSSCSVPVAPGDILELAVVSPSSTSVQFSNNCAPPDGEPRYRNSCQLTAAMGTNTVDVTPTPHPKLAWTRFVPLVNTTFDVARRVAFDSANDLLVATDQHLVKLAATDGTALWMLPLQVRDLDTGPSGTSYVVADADKLMKLGPDGAVEWSRTLPTAATGQPELFVKNIDVAADGTVAVRNGGLSYWSATGTMQWAITPSGFIVQGVAIESSGNVVLSRYDSGTYEVFGRRYAAVDGSQLADVPAQIGCEGLGGGGLGIDGAGAFTTIYSGHNWVCSMRGGIETRSALPPGTPSIPVGVRVAPGGEYAFAQVNVGGSSASATRYGAAGDTLATAASRLSQRVAAGSGFSGFSLGDSGHLSTCGSYVPIVPNGTSGFGLGLVQLISP